MGRLPALHSGASGLLVDSQDAVNREQRPEPHPWLTLPHLLDSSKPLHPISFHFLRCNTWVIISVLPSFHVILGSAAKYIKKLFLFFLEVLLATCANLLQSCPTLCNLMDCSPPGSSVHGHSAGKNWSGLPCLPPGNLPNQGSNPRLMSPALSGGFFTTSATWEASPVCEDEEHFTRAHLQIIPTSDNDKVSSAGQRALGMSWVPCSFPGAQHQAKNVSVHYLVSPPPHPFEVWKWSRSVVSSSLRPHGL